MLNKLKVKISNKFLEKLEAFLKHIIDKKYKYPYFRINLQLLIFNNELNEDQLKFFSKIK